MSSLALRREHPQWWGCRRVLEYSRRRALASARQASRSAVRVVPAVDGIYALIKNSWHQSELSAHKVYLDRPTRLDTADPRLQCEMPPKPHPDRLCPENHSLYAFASLHMYRLSKDKGRRWPPHRCCALPGARRPRPRIKPGSRGSSFGCRFAPLFCSGFGASESPRTLMSSPLAVSRRWLSSESTRSSWTSGRTRRPTAARDRSATISSTGKRRSWGR